MSPDTLFCIYSPRLPPEEVTTISLKSQRADGQILVLTRSAGTSPSHVAGAACCPELKAIPIVQKGNTPPTGVGDAGM